MPDDQQLDRRQFLKTAAAAGAGVMVAGRVPAPAIGRSGSANERVVVAVAGLNGRGMVHAQNFGRVKNAEVAYLCDVDSAVLAKAMKASAADERTPKAIGDF